MLKHLTTLFLLIENDEVHTRQLQRNLKTNPPVRNGAGKKAVRVEEAEGRGNKDMKVNLALTWLAQMILNPL